MPAYDPPGQIVLLHNSSGLRIEFNIQERASYLNLWTSPLAGKSNDYRERNFSNRDDHTKVFARISLPNLTQANFVNCDYDPTHTVVQFKDQRVHLLPHPSESALAVWTEQAQAIDFKSKSSDTIHSRDSDHFAIAHTDRWHDFIFTARIGDKRSRFVHQLLGEEGRSSYARLNLHPRRSLILHSALASEPPTIPLKLAKQSITDLEKKAEASLSQALDTGKIQLRGRDEWATLHKTSRKHLFTARDKSGAVRAALSRIYYLIWVRDGAFIEANIAYSGWSHGANLWKTFLLANPTRITEGASKGKAFLMLVNQITKWEEDGLFYAVWSAFSSMTQWRCAPTSEELATLDAATEWLEDYCFNAVKGLFGRNYACETPLIGSRDFGYDNAVGNPTDTPPPKAHNGVNALLSYDIYINEIAFSSYCMLAAMHDDPEKADSYLTKAKNLKSRMERWYRKGLPPYGYLLLEDGQLSQEPAYGLDLTDYVWAFTAPPISSHPHRLPEIRETLLAESKEHAPEYFLSGYFSLIRSLDTLYVNESKISQAIDYAVRQSAEGGSTLAMPYAIKEKLDVPDGDPWHDVRPQSFSAAPYLSCLSNLVLRAMPFGLAIRPSGIVHSLTNYHYRETSIDLINHCGQVGFAFEILIDGETLQHSLQIPESLLENEKVTVEIKEADSVPFGPLLVSSTVRLSSINEEEGNVSYAIDTFGYNTLEFEGAGLHFELTHSSEEPTPELEVHNTKDSTFISFWGRGRFEIGVARRGDKNEISSHQTATFKA